MAASGTGAYESGGNLDTIAQAQLSGWIRNGQAFSATTGQAANSTGSNNTLGACIWHAATNNKNWFIYSCKLSNNGGSSMGFTYIPTSNPSFASNLTIINAQAGGGNSSLGASPNGNATFAQAAASTPAGNLLEAIMVPQSQGFEMLPSGIYVPAGQAGGLAVYDFIATTAAWAATFRWFEF